MAQETGYGYGSDGVTHTTDACECDGCGQVGYLTYLPGEGVTDDEHPVLVTPGRRDGSELWRNFCEDCAAGD